LAAVELKMRVNSPCPEPLPEPAIATAGGAPLAGGGLRAGALGALADGAVADGALASGAFIARNICVKLPASPAPDAGAGAVACTAGKDGGVFSAA
jgi:hypothetical protein